MALSGTFQNYPVSSFGLYCEWSGVQSVTSNYTDVTLKVYLSYYTLEVGARSDSTISVNGVSETYTAPAINDYSSGWKKKLLKTKTVRVSHNADGTTLDRVLPPGDSPAPIPAYPSERSPHPPPLPSTASTAPRLRCPALFPISPPTALRFPLRLRPHRIFGSTV